MHATVLTASQPVPGLLGWAGAPQSAQVWRVTLPCADLDSLISALV